MSETSPRLAGLHQRLMDVFKGQTGPDIRVLPDNQMLISKHMAPNRAAKQASKASSFVPGQAGYQIYVAYRSPDEHAAAVATSQRMLGPAERPAAWEPGSMALRLGQTALSSEWRLLNPAGQVVAISVDCGSNSVVAEVNTILAEIQAVLLS